MVGSTRGNPGGFAGASGSRTPPPPLGLTEVLAAQTELLCQIAQGQQWASYQDFLSTQPPLFNKAEEPLDADAWIRTIESKFSLLTIPCSEASKAYFAA